MAMSNGIESFLVIYGSKDKKLDTTDNFNKFNVSMCKGLAFVHTFTGYDTASSFYQFGKAKFWAVWLAKLKAGDTTFSIMFKEFSNCPMNSEVNEFDTLCNFST